MVDIASGIEQIRAKLAELDSLQFVSEADSITIPPVSDNGFEIWVTELDGEFTVHFEGWHEDFEDIEDALACILFGLSAQCRLKVSRRGRTTYKWTVESRDEGQWIEDSTTALLVFPFWKKNEVKYLTNGRPDIEKI